MGYSLRGGRTAVVVFKTDNRSSTRGNLDVRPCVQDAGGRLLVVAPGGLVPDLFTWRTSERIGLSDAARGWREAEELPNRFPQARRHVPESM